MDVVINVDEIPEKNGNAVYGIENKTYLQLYRFYADGAHSQHNRYIIDNTSVKYKSDVLTDDLGVYGRFGIFFSDEVITDKRQYMLFIREQDLISRDALLQRVTDQQSEYDCQNFYLTAVEKLYGTDDECKKDAELIAEVLPNTTVINNGFAVDNRYISTITRRKGFEYYDVSELFVQNSVTTASSVINMTNAYKIADEIKQLAEPGRLFYLDYTKLQQLPNHELDAINHFVVNVAAYLAVSCGVHFEFNGRMTEEVLQSVGRYNSQEFNYLDEYLERIAHPLQFGIVFRDNNAYFCIKDVKTMSSDKAAYEIKIATNEVDFDEIGKQIVGQSTKSVVYSLQAIEVMSLEDLFEIRSADFSRAYNGLENLNVQIARLEEMLSKYCVNDKDSLCLSNVLLFRHNGQCKIGYVPTIDCKVPYVLTPVDPSFSPFRKVFDHKELQSILDVNVAVDGSRWIERFQEAKFISTSGLHYKLPSHAKGIILSDMKVYKERLCDVQGVTLEEIGVWYPALTQYRGNKALVIYKHIVPKAAREHRLLTYFGGPFTYNSISIRLGPKCWR